jgi:dTDP-4-amino-4,6-dideoxygalactose transaminase
MIKVSSPSFGKLEKDAVVKVLDSHHTAMGEEVALFEIELGEYLKTDYQVICVNSATAAMHLAFESFDFSPGAEVLVPTITYVATFQAILCAGLKPIACDIEEETGLIDLQSAKNKFNSNTVAICNVLYASETSNVDKVDKFAKEHGIRVVEDAAHAFGCSFEGKKIGSRGDVICFSFDSIKNITCGDGGAVLTSDKVLAQKIKDKRLLGVMGDSQKRYHNQRSLQFDVEQRGWRYHMNNIAAAIGRAQLQRFDRELAPPKIQAALSYREAFRDCNDIQLLDSSLESNSKRIIPHIFPIKILNGKNNFAQKLKDNGIGFTFHYLPNHLLTLFKCPSLPQAERFYSQIISLPLHSNLKENDVNKIIEVVNS